MKRDKGEKLIGKTIVHKKYGNVIVDEFISYKDDKFRGIIEETNEVKTFILSSNYFSDPNGMQFTKKFEDKKPRRVPPKRDIDYDKYRNHPTVKKIDKSEKLSYNQLYTTVIEDDDDNYEDNY